MWNAMHMTTGRWLMALCALSSACSDSGSDRRIEPKTADSAIEADDPPVKSDGGASSGPSNPPGRDGGQPDAGDRDDRADAGGDAGPDAIDPSVRTLGIGEACTAAGTACAADLECESTSGRCCPPGRDCCDVASDCPASYGDERGCVAARECRGSVETPRCSDHLCSSAFVASSSDASGCAELQCEPPTCLDGVLELAGQCDADGACVQPAPSRVECSNGLGCDAGGSGGCASQCVPGTRQGCQPYHSCSEDGTSCASDANEGTDCSQATGGPAVCTGNATCNPVNQRCCIDGLCCETTADCADSADGVVYQGPACSEAASCRGEQREKLCGEDKRCKFSAVAANGACDGHACPTGTCSAGVCTPRSKGEACVAPAECWGGECREGACTGGRGESCGLGGIECAPPLWCWRADPVGQTGRCTFFGECDFCEYRLPGRDGGCAAAQPFTAMFYGLPGATCYAATPEEGVIGHEIACNNRDDDDEDKLIDAADPDCMTPNTIWTQTTGRAAGSLCQWPSCSAGSPGGVVQCASGVGGCFDQACHSTICWPNAGDCALASPSGSICKWWHTGRDLDHSCGINELVERPNGSDCGPGCSCLGGFAEEFLCADGRDNDFDGLIDTADSDCLRGPGERCMAGRPNGGPDLGDRERLISGFVGEEDQCTGPDTCWCADTACSRGVCLDDQADCFEDAAFLCNAYPRATATGCGSPTARADGVAAYPAFPPAGVCKAGVGTVLGTKGLGETCTAWHECASALCACGNEDCSARVCWQAGDCANDLCQYRVDATSCLPTSSPQPFPCAGGEIMGIDLRQSCACAIAPMTTGPNVMTEVACDDGISNDWPSPSSGHSADLDADWLDPDCHGFTNFHLQVFLRYNSP
jgi:hypothetical protein